MRMWDITVIVICFELALQLCVGISVFTYSHYTPSQQSVIDVNGYTTGDMNQTSKLISSAKTQNADYFSLGMWTFNGLNLFISMVGSIVFFYPHLVSVFGLPVIIATPIQCLIYLSYGVGIAQFISGRSTNMMQ